MGKGGYLGGSTLVGQGSGWFGAPNPKVERQYAVGRAEGEAALERKRHKERAAQEQILKANAKLAKNLDRRERKIAKNRETLEAAGKTAEVPLSGTKGAKSLEQSQARMSKVEVVTKTPKRVVRKPATP